MDAFADDQEIRSSSVIPLCDLHAENAKHFVRRLLSVTERETFSSWSLSLE